MDALFDVLVKGGDVFESGSRTLKPMDVGFKNGRVAAMRPTLEAHTARIVLDATGSIVAPGLIDVHAHVFHRIGDSVNPDTACLPRGTTTVADGGSAGANSFEAFEYLMRDKRTNVLAWLNLSTIGQVDTRVGELLAMPHADVARAVATVEKYPDLIVGLKARLSTYVIGGTTKPVLRLLRECADAVNLPIMIHIGDTAEPLSDILPFLRKGDVVTHMMTGRKNGIVDASGRVHPQVREARERGVLFDASRGLNHESFLVLKACLDQGFYPDTISTDLTKDTASTLNYGLLLMATHMLHFGMRLVDVLAGVTSSASAMLHRTELGSLVEGGPGDCTVLRIDDQALHLVDVDGRMEDAQRHLRVAAVVRKGEVVPSTAAAAG